jgi:hypothetical protein
MYLLYRIHVTSLVLVAAMASGEHGQNNNNLNSPTQVTQPAGVAKFLSNQRPDNEMLANLYDVLEAGRTSDVVDRGRRDVEDPFLERERNSGSDNPSRYKWCFLNGISECSGQFFWNNCCGQSCLEPRGCCAKGYVSEVQE